MDSERGTRTADAKPMEPEAASVVPKQSGAVASRIARAIPLAITLLWGFWHLQICRRHGGIDNIEVLSDGTPWLLLWACRLLWILAVAFGFSCAFSWGGARRSRDRGWASLGVSVLATLMLYEAQAGLEAAFE